MGSLAERVVAIRAAIGLDRAGLSDRSGLHESHIGQIENGKRLHPQMETLVKLARGLGVPVTALTDDDYPTEQAVAEAAYGEAFRVARAEGLHPRDILDVVDLVVRLKRQP